MNEEATQSTLWWLSAIKAEISAISTTLVAIFVIVAIGYSCSSPDLESELMGCRARSIEQNVSEFKDPAYERVCMSAHGYDYRWESDECTVATINAGCFERRGIWRSTKEYGRRFREWMRAKK